MLQLTPFLTFFLVTCAACWLFVKRAEQHSPTRWIYLAYALAFACFTVGALPNASPLLTMVGVIISIASIGLGVLIKLLIDFFSYHGLHQK